MPGATPVFGLPYPLMGETVGAADFAALAAAIDTLLQSQADRADDDLNRPYLLLTSAAYSIANGVETALPWTEIDDPEGMFAPGSPTLVTIQETGVYQIVVRHDGGLGWASWSSVRVGIFVNGAMIDAERKAPPGVAASDTEPINVELVYPLTAGDVITARFLWIGTGGPLVGGGFGQMNVRWVCPL